MLPFLQLLLPFPSTYITSKFDYTKIYKTSEVQQIIYKQNIDHTGCLFFNRFIYIILLKCYVVGKKICHSVMFCSHHQLKLFINFIPKKTNSVHFN